MVGGLERGMFEEGNLDGDFGEWYFPHFQGSDEIVSFMPRSWTSNNSFESIWIIAGQEKTGNNGDAKFAEHNFKKEGESKGR